MKKVTIFIVLLVFCVLLAIWSPWTSLRFTLSSLFGIKQASEVAGLQVISLSGDLEVLLDGEKIGEATSDATPFIIDNIQPGDHLLTLQKISEIENAYWKFSKVINFNKGTTVAASFNLGPTEEFSEGHLIYFTENQNPENKKNLVISLNVKDANLTLNDEDPIQFEGTILSREIPLTQQHSVLLHKDGYDDLQFNILPATQEDRDKLLGLILNIDAHLLLKPVDLVVE